MTSYWHACVDLERFVRGGPTLTSENVWFYVDEVRREDPNNTKSGLSSSQQRKAIQLPNIECWLIGFVIFQGIQTSIIKESYSFLIFLGGSPALRSSPLDPRMPWADSSINILVILWEGISFTVFNHNI